MTEQGVVRVTAGSGDEGKRADAVLSQQLNEFSRSLIHRMFEEGYVRLNEGPVKPSYRMRVGDILTMEIRLPPSFSAEPEDINLTVVYEDSDFAVIDKPAGMVVHPAPGHLGGTLANALVSRYPRAVDVGNPFRPGIVHRLDKDTSGLIMVALSPKGERSLQQQIASRQAGREYLALATGKVAPSTGIIDAPVGRDPSDRKRMAVHGVAARSARTAYSVEEVFDSFTLVRARLETGRTHQIRVHFAAVGHPLAGDVAYRGPRLAGLERQFLHATRLSVLSPASGKPLEFNSPLPADLESVLATARAGNLPSI
jgi:23S rRNA pseudouridine1911/1915/1917 synthase